MTRIIGISGSLRKASYNAALLRAAIELAPKDVEMEIGSIKDIPLYDGDLESEQGLPNAVSALKDRIAAAEGLLLVTPEYNNSIPGVFKNAIDWLSRPSGDATRVFGGKPVGVIGATPGGMGTVLAQSAWFAVLRTLGTRPFFGKPLYVSGAGKVFDSAGRLSDDSVREKLRSYLEDFARFVSIAKVS
jgi:NAD(P)H-dependent FMN reductase